MLRREGIIGDTKRRVLENRVIGALQKVEKSGAGLSHHGASLLRMMRENKREMPDDDDTVRDESPSSELERGTDKKSTTLRPSKPIHMTSVGGIKPQIGTWTMADARAFYLAEKMWMKIFIAKQIMWIEMEQWEREILRLQIMVWYSLNKTLKKRGWLLPNEAVAFSTLESLFRHMYWGGGLKDYTFGP